MALVTSPHTYTGFRDAYYWLDPEIDGDPIEDAWDICQHILAHGSCRLHADAWSNDHDPLSLLPLRYRRKSDPVRHYHRVDHHAHGEPQQQYDPLPWEMPPMQQDASEAITNEIDAYIFRRYGPQ